MINKYYLKSMAMLVAIFIVLQLAFTCISKSKNTTNKERKLFNKIRR